MAAMDKFPDDFKPESFGKLKEPPVDDDDMRAQLAKVREQIVAAVKTAHKEYQPHVIFLIDHTNNIVVAYSKEQLEAISQTDYNKCGEKLRAQPRAKERRDFLIEKIGRELADRFGDNFKTLHETHWNSDCMQFYTVKERGPTNECCIFFREPTML